jgi:hypothetical protein
MVVIKILCKYGYLLLLCAIISCGSSNNNVIPEPSDLIDKETMTNIITDLHIADAGVQRLYLPPDSAEQLVKIYYAAIAQKYGISFATINNSFNYYLSKPALLDSMFTKSIEKLSTLESQARAEFIKTQNLNTDTLTNNSVPIKVIKP